MSVGSQVAPGTPCAPCRVAGHFCAAYEIEDRRAVCLHCLDGELCPRMPKGTPAAAPAKVAPVKPFAAAAVTRPAGKMVTVTVPPSTAKVFEEHPLRPGIPVRQAEPKPAPAAKPEPATPRRHFPAARPALSTRGCGQPAHRGQCRGRLPAPPTKPAVHPVAQAEETVAKGKEIFKELELERAVFAGEGSAAKALPLDEGMAKVNGMSEAFLQKNKWTRAPRVMDLADVPGGRMSVYDDGLKQLQAAPVGKAVCLPYPNPQIAETYREAIAKRAQRAGLKMSSIATAALGSNAMSRSRATVGHSLKTIRVSGIRGCTWTSAKRLQPLQRFNFFEVEGSLP